MYFDYLAERRPECQTLETEKGFAIYSYTEHAVYIEEIYVRPDFRNSSVASDFSNAIQAEAFKKGVTILLGSVSPSAVGATASIRVLLAHGMSVLSSQDDLVWFTKEIKG